MQKVIYEIKDAKDEKINELQGFVAKKFNDKKELEIRLNLHIKDFKNEIEISKQEILLFKDQKENEKIELLNVVSNSKAEYELLKHRYQTYERNL